MYTTPSTDSFLTYVLHSQYHFQLVNPPLCPYFFLRCDVNDSEGNERESEEGNMTVFSSHDPEPVRNL
eukprot:m.19581 g.19581  ORF g.19581 m.19581 type:complete len:68 (-) comp8484_c0_seq1:1007-1210(-)